MSVERIKVWQCVRGALVPVFNVVENHDNEVLPYSPSDEPMTWRYLIRVVGERAADVHRTRNMAEELHVEFVRCGYGTTSDPDVVTTEFQINVESKKNLGDAALLVRAILRKHYLTEEDVEIESVR